MSLLIAFLERLRARGASLEEAIAQLRAARRFVQHTVQLRVPDFAAGVAFYARLFGRPPDVAPHVDFVEWFVGRELVLQLGVGAARQVYAMRFRVDDLEAERGRLDAELGVACTPAKRVGQLVTFCDFDDPWGNRLGLYEPVWSGAEPPMPGGSERDW